MSGWTEAELGAIGDAYDLEISSRRRDGTFSPKVTIWAIRLGNGIYARSVRGPSATWYRGATRRGAGRIWSGGVERNIVVRTPDQAPDDQIDDAYRQKFGVDSVGTERIIAPLARETTILLVPNGA